MDEHRNERPAWRSAGIAPGSGLPCRYVVALGCRRVFLAGAGEISEIRAAGALRDEHETAEHGAPFSARPDDTRRSRTGGASLGQRKPSVGNRPGRAWEGTR